MKSPFDALSLGLQELIAVLVPGAALNAFLLYRLANHENLEKDGWPFIFAFSAASYFVGYALFVASSPLEGFYDRVKRFALGIDTIEKPNKAKILLYFLIPFVARRGDIKTGEPKKPSNCLVNMVFPYLWNTHLLIQAVVEHKNKHIGASYEGDDDRVQPINAYQYCYRLLMYKQPVMFAEVERYMVTAKFFRSMVVVWFICGLALWIWPDEECRLDGLFVNPWIFLLLSFISFFTYLNRWRKAHHVAFKNAIISVLFPYPADDNPQH